MINIKHLLFDDNGVKEVTSTLSPDNFKRFKNEIFLNSSPETNLIYKITPKVDDSKREELNSLETYSTRIKWLIENGYNLTFAKMSNEFFRTNLELIDSRLPEILSHLLLHRYLGGPTKLAELTNYLNKTNPCNFNTELNSNFYTYKIKRLLVDTALGMKAVTLWTGTFSATGGYIVVKKDGELLCFHIYNWNDFQDYLLNYRCENIKVHHLF